MITGWGSGLTEFNQIPKKQLGPQMTVRLQAEQIGSVGQAYQLELCKKTQNNFDQYEEKKNKKVELA